MKSKTDSKKLNVSRFGNAIRIDRALDLYKAQEQTHVSAWFAA